MYFKAVDFQGNEVEYKAQKFSVDETAPATTVVHDCDGTMPFNVTVEGNDTQAGVATMQLWFRHTPDGETWSDWMLYNSTNMETYTFEFIYNPGVGYYKPGWYEFYVYAEDALGNAKSLTPTNESWCYVPPIPEDFNGDGRVNVVDLYEIITHWGETGSPGWIAADLNNDGVIDTDDIYLLIIQWTG
jgi:hypothetical protein